MRITKVLTILETSIFAANFFLDEDYIGCEMPRISGNSGRTYDPICVACYLHTGLIYYRDWKVAGRKLGLFPWQSKKINYYTYNKLNSSRWDKDWWIRNRLENLCLKEEEI